MYLKEVLIFVLCYASGSLAAECTRSKIDECMTPLNGFEKDVNAAVVVYLSEKDLREHCRLYQLFDNCMKDVRHSCSKLDLLLFEGVDDAYHFLCEEAIDEYLQYRDCFNNTDLHEEGESCNTTLTTKLQSLGTSKSASYRKDRICQYATGYLDCVQNAVFSFCGTKAAIWQRELDERSLRPILSELRCPGIKYNRNWWDTGRSNNTMATAIIITVLLLVCIIIGSLIVYMVLVYRRRKRLRDQIAHQQQQQSANQQQPQVVYDTRTNAGVSVLPAGWTPGDGAGPLPPKSLPPPYMSHAGSVYPGEDAGGPMNHPPAYSDISSMPNGSSANGSVANGSVANGSVAAGYNNPSYEASDYQRLNRNLPRKGSQ